jgi:anion transporter
VTDREVAATRRERAIGVAGVLVATVAVLWGAFAAPPSGVSPGAQGTFAVFAFALVLWLTEAVPHVVASSLAVVLLAALGAAPSFQAAASGFASRLVFFLLFVLTLGRAISEVDLDEWLAARFLATNVRSSRPVELLATGVFASALVMPSAVARAVTFLPIARRLGDAYGFDRGGGFERSSFLVLGHVNPIASMALMTGGGMALVTSGIVRNQVRPVSWVTWAVLMVPPVLVLYALAALTAERLYVDGDVTATDGRDVDVEEWTDRELTGDQQYVAAVLAGAVALWVLGSFLSIPAVVPAALAVAALSLPGRGVLTSEDVQAVSWGIVFVVAAMLSILDAMARTGALSLLVDTVTRLVPLGAFTHVEGVAVLLALAAVVRVFFSTGSAAIVVVLPVVLRLGRVLGVNRLFLSLSVLLVVGSTTVFPFNTTSVLVSFDRGPLTNTDVAAFGVVTTAYAVLVVALSWALYWPLVA